MIRRANQQQPLLRCTRLRAAPFPRRRGARNTAASRDSRQRAAAAHFAHTHACTARALRAQILMNINGHRPMSARKRQSENRHRSGAAHARWPGARRQIDIRASLSCARGTHSIHKRVNMANIDAARLSCARHRSSRQRARHHAAWRRRKDARAANIGAALRHRATAKLAAGAHISHQSWRGGIFTRAGTLHHGVNLLNAYAALYAAPRISM